MNALLKVSLRQQAIFVPDNTDIYQHATITETTGLLVANFANLGFGIAEPLLSVLNNTTPAFQLSVLNTLRDVTGVNKNWAPLVKGWGTPTGESIWDHIQTFYANLFKTKGNQLPCGHIIPGNTFPLERYNGCPFCGTPFLIATIENYKQGSQQKVLELWTMTDAAAFLENLLTSKTALDATQLDSLKTLLQELPLPSVAIGMKETLMAVIDLYIAIDQPAKAQALFTSPTDILRYLWYKHTGFLQIIEPATIIKRNASNNRHLRSHLDKSASAQLKSKGQLKLKYSRKDCLVVTTWLNNLPLDIAKMCEMMHPKRGMWVRFIRALRLAEYSKRKGFEKLANLLDKFYKEEYEVWMGKVEHFKLRYDALETLTLLQQRPGLFARSLFANMLWFGSEVTIMAFEEIVDKVPARLLFTLAMYADNYFDASSTRLVKPLGGVNKSIPANRLLAMHSQEDLEQMKAAVADLCILAVKKRFAKMETTAKTMYIDPALFKMPVSIGDRSETVQDTSSVLMGTRFAIAGDTVRLFMQWGTGLTAQHMDMDLSCMIAYEGTTERCSYQQLVATGCKHSGDIRSIPNKVGTAEYIEINLPALKAAKATYVSFTCNAYSNGSITPNMVIGWMNSEHRMTISEKTGVAYDPSCVQHQVRIVNTLSKGLLFGVLDVANSEIVWLEMQFAGQLVQDLSHRNVERLLRKLNSKLSIGELLRTKAEAQGLVVVDSELADEVYTVKWGQNAAAVSQLLID